MVRTRFAPSPTGYLHIGSARTALFSWLFACHHKGEFLLRVEDTDVKRSEKKYLDEILESLKWLGIKSAQEPIFQSKRFDVYKKYAEKLIGEDKAYHEKGAVIFKIPPKTVQMDDLVHGEIEFDNSLLGNLVIIKSDGTPTYNFACTIDDAQMQITHVIRGDDHISNTPKQIALYHALGIKLPEFVHIPLILGPDRSKLSKRHGAVSIREYREKGFLPETLVNFLALLGWSPKTDKEIMSIDELISNFDIKGINKTSAIFDYDKLVWMNGQYVKNKKSQELVDLVGPILVKRKRKPIPRQRVLEIIELFKGRVKVLSEFGDQTQFLFKKTIEYDPQAVSDYLSSQKDAQYLSILRQRLNLVSVFDKFTTEQALRELASELNIKAAQIIHPARVALTGKSISPGLFEVMELMGKDLVMERLDKAIKMAGEKNSD
jgi:glutamyl-tRNA synthetase